MTSNFHEWVMKVIVSSSDQISRSVVSDSLQPHESQHARPPALQADSLLSEPPGKPFKLYIAFHNYFVVSN